MLADPVIHYAPSGTGPVCDRHSGRAWDRVTDDMLLVTCGRCLRTTRYRVDVFATAEALVLNPEFLPGGGLGT